LPISIEDLKRRFARIERNEHAEADAEGLEAGRVNGSPSDQALGIEACREALEAAQEGNYGVGAILLDAAGEIVQRGHNQAFRPQFRSDLHAEMVVMNEFENRCPGSSDMRGYTLICSLEPCPMCLGRLLIAGVEQVKFLAHDELGGMVSHIDHLPEAWQKLRRRQQFVEAEVSDDLRTLSLELFILNLEMLRTKLWDR
jgi:tRNA(Arg) A34 adenosine deaminase TadA